jgi:hypothetical protein
MTIAVQRARRRKTERGYLLDAVRTHILPLLLRNGFSAAPVAKDRGPVDRELLLALPLGRLRRWRDDGGGVDLVEIDFSKDRRSFRLLVGVAPTEGLPTLTGHWPPEEVLVGWLDEFFEIYASPRWRRWFSVKRWPWQREARQADYDELAREVGSYLPELESALRTGQLGPHTRRVVIRGRVPKPVADTLASPDE